MLRGFVHPRGSSPLIAQIFDGWGETLHRLSGFWLNYLNLAKAHNKFYSYQQDSGISNFFLVITSSSWILNHSEFVQSEWDSIPQQKWVVWILSITLNRIFIFLILYLNNSIPLLTYFCDVVIFIILHFDHFVKSFR